MAFWAKRHLRMGTGFFVLTVVGSLGVVAIVIWMMID
jgi:hypothetical protein